MLVSGMLDPDATGTYKRAADYDGAEAWTRGDSAWSIWRSTIFGYWIISETIGMFDPILDASWCRETVPGPITGPYEASGTATGIATVTLSSE